jgi:hypothetical protein
VKTYTISEIEQTCSKIFTSAKNNHPDIPEQDLAALFLYTGAYILHTTSTKQIEVVDRILKDAAVVAYKWLTTHIEKDATLPISEESSEV